ncbi:MAG: hypothetical protein WCR21_01155 [Bacteroidota bacterium]
MLAQEDKLSRAQGLMTSDPGQALLIMDSVIQHPQTKNDFYTWTVRAYIYYELYKKTEKLKLHSAIRDSILSTIKTASELKPDSESFQSINRMYKSLSSGYKKIVKVLLEDSLNYEGSQEAFNNYKKLLLKVEPKHNFEADDIEYNLTVGSIFSNIFNEDNKKTKAGEIAKVALLKVLGMQPTNSSANLNLGLMYYNQAANLSKSLEYGADFTEIDAIQDNMIKLAKQSEKLIRSVYDNDNKNTKSILALYYIYRMLVDTPKFEEFKKKCKEMNLDIGENKPAATEENLNNPQNKDK